MIDAELHVFVSVSHCFDLTLLGTLIQQDVNPIERIERTSLIVASTIHNCSVADATQPEQRERLAAIHPTLFLEA